MTKRRYKMCPCCGYFTLPGHGRKDICPVCFWEDDPVQSAHEQSREGANPVSLAEARKNYAGFGACETEVLPYVRKPLPEEAAPLPCPASASECGRIVEDLNHALGELCGRYLDAPDSAVQIRFDGIGRPDPAEILEPADPPEEALDAFLKEILNADAGRIPSGAHRLSGTFAALILERLQPFGFSFFGLSEEGYLKYKALLRPWFSLGMAAVSLGNHWFILWGEWSD